MRARRQVVCNGIEISYLVDGRPDAPVVVLIHGGSLDSGSWVEVLDELVEDHRVYAPEMRGHGRGSWTPTYSFDLLAEDVDGFVESLGLSEVALVGRSIGGAERIPDARVEVISVGHGIHEDAPERFLRALLAFLRQ